jgi:mono/diheme cytochrome c family protein
MYRHCLIAACTAVAMIVSQCVPAADNEPAAPTTQAQPGSGTPNFSVKNTFRNICSFCHENYGRKPGKGPQLMGTQLTDEQIFNRIKNGKPGRMAAFGGTFSDDQIHQIVAFIRALKPDVEP